MAKNKGKISQSINVVLGRMSDWVFGLDGNSSTKICPIIPGVFKIGDPIPHKAVPSAPVIYPQAEASDPTQVYSWEDYKDGVAFE